MNAFSLHPQLNADTNFISDWPLSRVLLMDDARFPWLILVPRRPDLVEFHDLNTADRAILSEEISRASIALKAVAGAAKVNIGALGNLVPQLHIHVVARNSGDAAWPGPVWGFGQRVPYDAAARDRLLEALRTLLA